MRRPFGEYQRSNDYETKVKDATGPCKYPLCNHDVFEVVGAGFISIGQSVRDCSGTAVGCAFDASWSRFGYSGGVMDMSEVVRLRDKLNALIAESKRNP